VGRIERLAVHDAGTQVTLDQPQQTFIPDLAAQARHEQIVVDPVKELRQVDVHRDLSTAANVGLYLSHRLVCTTMRTETIAMG
jgi:hypothetical protein